MLVQDSSIHSEGVDSVAFQKNTHDHPLQSKIDQENNIEKECINKLNQ